jgi:hypothetical protein
MTVLRASPVFRRGVLLVALAVVVLEVGLFAVLWRLGALVDPGADPRAAATFVLLGTVVTLQAMAVVGVVWVMVALAWTTLRVDALEWSLEHPWRSWHGQPCEVDRAWRHGAWLVLELDGQWRRWYVRVSRDDDATVEALRGHLADGAWLDVRGVGAHLARTVLPVVAAGALIGALALAWILRVLNQMHGT